MRLPKGICLCTVALAAWGVALGSTASAESDLEPSAPEKILFLGVLTRALPSAVGICQERLERAMAAAGEKDLAATFTEEDLHQWVIRQVQGKSRGMLSRLSVKIQPGSLVGSGELSVGGLRVRLLAQVGIRAVNGSPRLALQQVRMNEREVPAALLRQVEQEVNRAIGGRKSRLQFRDLDLKEGAAWVRAETS